MVDDDKITLKQSKSVLVKVTQIVLFPILGNKNM